MAFGKTRTLLGRSKKQPTANPADRAAPTDDWMHPMPLPEVREGGESTWEAWQEESRRMDLAFAETQPSGAIPLTGSAPAPQQADRRGAHWSADDVAAIARRGSRVCPRPYLWSALYVLIEGDRHADLQPPPVQTWEWASLSNLQRRERFLAHIHWAERHDKLDAMGRFVEAIAEPDWVHLGEN